ncbi:MAG: NAD-dependent epimerase/dehydratase family protein [Deltaproteobacteria bacterium]|nr:MAG: NAD-dependent epimerase/dehydratase family protein [Deltaproteobacteria bacterium]
MKVAVVGASGGVGRELVVQAVAAGHEVVAIGRQTSDLAHAPADGVRRGDVDDEAFLTHAFSGVDVVLVAIGLKLSGLAPWARVEDRTLLRRAGPAIARAAEAAGVSRVIAVSAGGAGDSYGAMPLFFKAFIAMTAMRVAYQELDRFEEALFAGAVDTLCVRPTGLTDAPATGEVVVAERLVGQAQISRADVAGFMLTHLEGPLPSRGPVITVTGAG